MQDTKVIHELLKHLAEESDGKLIVPAPHSASDIRKLYQLDLLCDEGLAVRIGNGCYQITSTGEETLLQSNAID